MDIYIDSSKTKKSLIAGILIIFFILLSLSIGIYYASRAKKKEKKSLKEYEVI